MAIAPWSMIAAVLLQNMEGIPMKQLIKEVDWLKRQASNLGAYIDWPGMYFTKLCNLEIHYFIV